MMQNGYAYRLCDRSICQKYHTSGLCNIALNAEIEYKRNIDLFYSLNAYKMRVNVREYRKDNQKFEINFVSHEKFFLSKNWI
jgi:hypothetical protein